MKYGPRRVTADRGGSLAFGPPLADKCRRGGKKDGFPQVRRGCAVGVAGGRAVSDTPYEHRVAGAILRAENAVVQTFYPFSAWAFVQEK